MRWPVLLALLGGALMAGAQWLIFVYAPVEATMGLTQKIFYAHLPQAWWAFVSFFVVFIASLAVLRAQRQGAEARARLWDNLAAAACEIGVLTSGLSLITGSIWARQSWGVWWTWDPRLTTALVMWFVYAGYLVTRTLDLPPARRRTVCAVLGVLAFVDVPLVFLSARLWRSIHPAVFAARGGGLDPAMRLTVIACLVCFGVLWAALLATRLRQRQLADRIGALSQRRLDAAQSL